MSYDHDRKECQPQEDISNSCVTHTFFKKLGIMRDDLKGNNFYLWKIYVT